MEVKPEIPRADSVLMAPAATLRPSTGCCGPKARMGAKIIASRICADYMATNTQTKWLKTTAGARPVSRMGRAR